jgi:hypothetical protein
MQYERQGRTVSPGYAREIQGHGTRLAEFLDELGIDLVPQGNDRSLI